LNGLIIAVISFIGFSHLLSIYFNFSKFCRVWNF